MEKTDLLIQSYLKRLRLPSIASEYKHFSEEAAKTNLPYDRFLLALLEQEVVQRDARRIKDRIKKAKFPRIMTLDMYDFTALPSLNKQNIIQLAQGSYLDKAEVLIFIGNAGTGKTHLSTALGICACQQNRGVRYFTASALINETREAMAEHRLSRFEKSLDRMDLIIVDELGYIPIDREGANFLFNFFAARYERKSVIVSSNLEFSQWTENFAGDERLTGALLDRLTHHSHIFTMNGASYRFKESQRNLEIKEKRA
jgi:DNA replication protein DnaC